MTTMTTEAYQLTANDIKALRTCDTIVFRYARHQETSQLEVIKNADKNNVWEQTKVIQVATSSEVYPYEMRLSAAVAIMYRYTWHEDELATVLGLLKPGDILSVHLIAGNNNGLLDKAGLQHDTLSIRITRKGKSMLFRVHDQVSQPGYGRMCQTEPRD